MRGNGKNVEFHRLIFKSLKQEEEGFCSIV
jgi:hypothetical protein